MRRHTLLLSLCLLIVLVSFTESKRSGSRKPTSSGNRKQQPDHNRSRNTTFGGGSGSSQHFLDSERHDTNNRGHIGFEKYNPSQPNAGGYKPSAPPAGGANQGIGSAFGGYPPKTQNTHVQSAGAPYPTNNNPGGFGGAPAGSQYPSGGFGNAPQGGGFGQPGGFGTNNNPGGFGNQQPGFGGHNYNQGSHNQPGFGGTTYNQPGAGGFGSHSQPGFGGNNYNQGSHNQPGFGGNYNQPGAGGFGSHNQPGFGSHNQPGFGQSGYNQPGFGQSGYNQPGFGNTHGSNYPVGGGYGGYQGGYNNFGGHHGSFGGNPGGYPGGGGYHPGGGYNHGGFGGGGYNPGGFGGGYKQNSGPGFGTGLLGGAAGALPLGLLLGYGLGSMTSTPSVSSLNPFSSPQAPQQAAGSNDAYNTWLKQRTEEKTQEAAAKSGDAATVNKTEIISQILNETQMCPGGTGILDSSFLNTMVPCNVTQVDFNARNVTEPLDDDYKWLTMTIVQVNTLTHENKTMVMHIKQNNITGDKEFVELAYDVDLEACTTPIDNPDGKLCATKAFTADPHHLLNETLSYLNTVNVTITQFNTTLNDSCSQSGACGPDSKPARNLTSSFINLSILPLYPLNVMINQNMIFKTNTCDPTATTPCETPLVTTLQSIKTNTSLTKADFAYINFVLHESPDIFRSFYPPPPPSTPQPGSSGSSSSLTDTTTKSSATTI